MRDCTTFDEAPMRAAEPPPAVPFWQVFITFDVPEQHPMEVEYLVQAMNLRAAFEKAVKALTDDHGENGANIVTVLQFVAKRLPALVS